MTNYEWLCKEYKMVVVFREFKELAWCDFVAKYKIEKTSDSPSECLVNWLKSEHKATKWVRLDDVLMFVNAPIDIDPSKSFLGSDVIDKLETYQKYTSEQIRNTVIKEIEDD